MANITLSTTLSNIVVDSTNNIITVSSTPSNIVVGETADISVSSIRAALSNVSPILYNQSTGEFSFDSNASFNGKTTDDLAQGTNNRYWSTSGNAVTTTYLTEGTNLYFTAARARGNVSATSATGISYDSGTGVFSLASIPNSSLTNSSITINGTAVSLGGTRTLTTTDIAEGTNLYFTAARARGNVSATDAGGMGSFSYDSGTGAFTYTGPSNSEVRAVISATNSSGYGNISYSNSTGVITYVGTSNSDIRTTISTANTTTGHGNISYNNSTGVITFDRVTATNILSELTAGNVKLKQYSETAVNNGNISGNVTFALANGTIHNANVSGNITGISFTGITAGSSATLILKQDVIGARKLITTGAQWNNWNFLQDYKTLSTYPGNVDILTVIYDGSTYHASLLNMDEVTAIQNSQLANSNVVVNGVTIALGSSGNIDTFNSNVTVNGNLNVSGNLNYQNVTDLYVTDQKITLNSNAATNANVQIISNRPTATSTDLKWNEPATRWEFTNNGTTYYPIPTSTTDLAEGANLYFTAARARGNISVAENLTYNSSTGVIGMANSLANVNSIVTETTANATVTADEMLEFKARKRNNTLVSGANIHAEGFAVTQGANFFNAPFISKISGSGELKSYVFDATITSGSNVITVTGIYDLQTVTANVSDVSQYYVFSDYPVSSTSTAFPPGTYVTSVSGNNIYMSANATRSDTFVYDNTDPVFGSYGGLSPGIYDSTTGLLIGLESEYDDGGASTQTITYNFMTKLKPLYGYGASGPVTTDFVYSRDSAANYSIDTTVLNQFLTGRTNFSATQTVGNFRRGLTIGDADLTNRGENDGLQTFGLSVVWDGQANVTADYGSSGIFPQILLKQYTTGTNQGLGATALTNSGPRLMLSGAYGKNTDSILGTYARNNQEVGRISWISTTDVTAEPSTTTPPAFISVVSNRDQTGGFGAANDFGMYLVASPSATSIARAMWAGHYKANTIISAGSRSGGTSGNIIFAPARQTTNANTQLHPETIVNSACASPHWATIGYDNPAANTGARISVTNGNNAAAARNGNLTLALSRNSNFGVKEWALKVPSGNSLVLTEDGVIRTTFAAANITTAGNVSASTFLGNVSGATGAFTGNVDVTGNLNLTGRLLGYDKVYGEFAYTAGNITPAAADTVYTLPIDTTNMASDVVANNTSRINITKPGIFKFIMSLQVKNSSNAADHIMRFWLRKNGADVAGSATVITPLKQQEQVVAMDWMVESDGDDYWEIAYYVNDTNVFFPDYPAISSPVTAPQAPPFIVNVIPIGA